MRIAMLVFTLLVAGPVAQAKNAPAPAKGVKKAAKKTAAKRKKNLFHGQIYSYDMLMRLPQAKRVQYMKDLAAIVAKMEAAEKKHLVAKHSVEDFKEQVATLMKMMAVMPQAEAQGVAEAELDRQNVVNAIPAWNEEKKKMDCAVPGTIYSWALRACVTTQPSGLFGRSLTHYYTAGTCPSGTKAVKSNNRRLSLSGWVYYDECITQASWDRSPYKTELAAGTRFKYGDATGEREKDMALVFGGDPNSPAATGDDEAPPNVEQADTPAETQETEESLTATEEPAQDDAPGFACLAPEKVQCQNLSEAQKSEAVAKFRKGASRLECITSGNFMNYRNKQSKAGNCDVRQAFPSKKHSPNISCGKPSEALCNPLLFCVGVDVSSKFVVSSLCVPAKSNMTQACLDKFNAKLGGENIEVDDKTKKKLEQAGRTDLLQALTSAKPRACDVSKDLNEYAFKDEYMYFKKKMEEKYQQLCGGDENFQALFCGECEIMGKQIYAANKRAGLDPCGGSAPVNPADLEVEQDGDSSTTR